MACQSCSASERLCTYPIPDIQNRLRTEFSPTAAQLSEIKEIIRSGEEDLGAYQTEINRLKSKIVLLTTKSDLLRKHVQKTRFLLSPIRRLPMEVLGHIFSYCCNNRFNLTSSMRKSRNSFLAVCSRWREVGLSAPQIWSVVDLEFIHHPQKDQLKYVQAALNLHLSRSRACPLDIRINHSRMLGKYEKKLAQTLVHHSNRWKHLSFESLNLEPFMSLAHLPMLETLQINVYVPPPHIKAMFPAKLPNLRHFSAPAFPGNVDAIVPWENLTNLEMDLTPDASFLGETSILNVVEQCTNLRTLTYNNVDHLINLEYANQIRALIVPQVSSSVTDLKIFLAGDAVKSQINLLGSIFGSFTLPSLESLTLAAMPYLNDFRMENWPLDTLRLFLERSACSITSLTLEGVGIPDGELISLLAMLPTLTDLSVHEEDLATVTKKFLNSLHSYDFSPFQDSPQPLLPKLQRLSLKAHGDWFSEKTFVKMVISRWLPQGMNINLASDSGKVAPVECLKWVKVHVMEKRVNKAVWERLQCVEAGLDGDGSGMKVLLIDEDPPSSDSSSDSESSSSSSYSSPYSSSEY